MRPFQQELAAYAPILGFDPSVVEQGSESWHRMRLGVVTASKADCLLAKSGTAKRDGYMAELVAEICTGLIPAEINAKALLWGKENEDEARAVYSASTFEVVESVPLIYKDDTMRFACSPDGLCSNHGLELKCPWASRTHIEFICADKIKPEYQKQCQFSMWVSGLETWDFASFDPRMKKSKKLRTVTVERDKAMMAQFDEASAAFIKDMDAMLAKIGIAFGDQWTNCPAAAGATETPKLH